MARVVVTINGVDYPCRPTMGAALRFKEHTGKEVTDMKEDSFSELCAYLYCCVASGAASEKIPFDLSFMEFADALTAEDLAEWSKSMQSDHRASADDGEKKSKRQRG